MTIIAGSTAIRRGAMMGAAAVAVALAPSVAMAYDAPGYGTTVSDTTPDLGGSTTVRCTGADAGQEMTLTVTSDPASIASSDIHIAGTKSLTKAANAEGIAVYVVTLDVAGAYTFVMTDPTGAVVSTQNVAVAAVRAAAAASDLSDTGFDGMGLAAGAGSLVVAGAGAVLIAKRRQSAYQPL